MRADRTFRRAATFFAATAASAAFAAPAHAQAPTPCNGFVKEDPAGDNTTYLLGNDSGAPSEANGDLLGLFINRTAAKTVLNLKVAEVNKDVPSGADSLTYRIFYTAGGTSRYLETSVPATGGEPSFEYGTFEGSPRTFAKEGDAVGAWHEGPNGVISIEIPAEAGGAMGVKFTEMYGWPGYGRGAILTPTDYIPDGGEDGARMTWNGAPCPETGAGPTPPPAMPGPTQPAPTQPAQASGPLLVTAAPSTFKARKVKKARKLALKMKTKEQLTNVVVTLKKGKKALGTGRLARLTNVSKMALKLRKKGLKKGGYSLFVTARRADGSTGTASLKLRVR